jgi:hypothetical protein
MRVLRIVLSVLMLTTLCACAIGIAEARQNTASSSQSASAQASAEAVQQVTVPLRDPARPATVRVQLLWGGITVRGTNRKDVLIEGRASQRRGGINYAGRGPIIVGRGGRASADTTGMRRLTQEGGFTIEEQNNEVVITSDVNRGTDFTIEVPARANLRLSTLNNGPVVVENVEGEIEVSSHNESATLTNVAGSVVVNSHNGHVKVVLTRLAADKAMAFTTFNGNVDVALPASVRANLKLRSDMGEIFTDFDVQTRPAAAAQSTRGQDGRIRIDVNQSIQGTVNGGGPEFEFRTYNGNIYVRRGAQ